MVADRRHYHLDLAVQDRVSARRPDYSEARRQVCVWVGDSSG